MRKQLKNVLLSTAALACTITVGAAVGTLSASASETHSLQIGPMDPATSYVLQPTGANSGIGYKTTSPLEMEGTDGIAIRVQNYKESTYTIKQVMLFDKESSLVYSPHKAVSYFYSVDGTVTSSEPSATDNARLVKVPGNFDGWIMMPYDQMTLLRYSSSTDWDWTNSGKLSKDSEGDWAYPTGSVEEIRFYSLDSIGESFKIGAHTTYTISESTVTLGEEVYLNPATKTTPSEAETIMKYTHSMQISADDFNSNAYAVVPSTDGKGGLQYNLTGNGLSLAGKTGLAFRIKNANKSEVKLDQFRFHVADSLLVYSARNSQATFYEATGGYFESSTNGRTLSIPAGFDGWMMLPFDQLTILRHSAEGSNWIWSETAFLSAEGEGDWALPTGSLGELGYFSVAGATPEFILGAHTTYTKTGNTVAIDANYTYIDTATLKQPSAEPLMSVASVSPVKFTFVAGANATVDAQEVTLKYGETYKIPATIADGYQAKVTIGEGENAVELDTLTFKHTYKNATALKVTVEGIVPADLAIFSMGEEAIELHDKKGLKFSVNNADGEAFTYELKFSDGEKFVKATQGAALIVADGIVKHGAFLTIPAGFVGDLYIPFNYTRGNYGQPQNIPFDYPAKPETALPAIYVGGVDKAVSEAVFSGFEFVTELPTVTAAATTNANLYVNGDSDFFGKLFADALQDKAANQAGSGSTWAISYKFTEEQPSFDVAGLAVRFKNLTGGEFGIRSYFVAGGKTFVPQAANAYTLINADGTIVEKKDTNRNMLMPTDFDGTILIDFSAFATDNAAATLAENIIRGNLTVSQIDFYIGCKSGSGAMFGDAAWIAYDGTVAGTFAYTADKAIDKNGKNEFAFRTVGTPVTANTSNVELSAEKVLFGTSEVIVTPVAGKVITSIAKLDGCEIEALADGSYKVTINNDYKANYESFQLQVTTDNAQTVKVNIGANGKVYYNGLEVTGDIVVGASGHFGIRVVPDIGYEAVVKADSSTIPGQDGLYAMPGNTNKITVEFIALLADLTVVLGENGSATLNGEALANGTETVEQGVKTLVVTPAKGYAETVKLGEEVLEKGENGYTVVLTENQTLSITFTVVNYTITYSLDRGTNAEGNPETYTVFDEVTLLAAEKDGYKFVGWFVMENGVEKQIKKIEKGSTGNLELIAKYTLETDEGNSGSSGCKSSLVFGAGAAVLALGVAILAFKKKEN